MYNLHLRTTVYLYYSFHNVYLHCVFISVSRVQQIYNRCDSALCFEDPDKAACSRHLGLERRRRSDYEERRRSAHPPKTVIIRSLKKTVSVWQNVYEQLSNGT